MFSTLRHHLTSAASALFLLAAVAVPATAQESISEEHIAAARETGLPLIIHSPQADVYQCTTTVWITKGPWAFVKRSPLLTGICQSVMSSGGRVS